MQEKQENFDAALYALIGSSIRYTSFVINLSTFLAIKVGKSLNKHLNKHNYVNFLARAS